MLAETYEKFKLQLQAKKVQESQLPEVVQLNEEQVHHICSYNHYPVKVENIQMGQCHNDIYDTDELNHEYEYGIYEDIVKSEQFMVELKQKQAAEVENTAKLYEEYDNFPIKHFSQAGHVANIVDPGLRQAAESELYTLEQDEVKHLFSSDNEYSEKQVSHMQQNYENDDRIQTHTVTCPVYVPFYDEKTEYSVTVYHGYVSQRQ